MIQAKRLNGFAIRLQEYRIRLTIWAKRLKQIRIRLTIRAKRLTQFRIRLTIWGKRLLVIDGFLIRLQNLLFVVNSDFHV